MKAVRKEKKNSMHHIASHRRVDPSAVSFPMPIAPNQEKWEIWDFIYGF
jgi:hypothetical protein